MSEPLVFAERLAAFSEFGRRSIRERGRPYITLSYAQSLDGCITLNRGSPTPISGSASLVVTHQLRAAHDAILIGIGTVLSDDPQLTVRLAEGPNPQPVILDSQLRFPIRARLLNHPQHLPWIVTSTNIDGDKALSLHQAGARMYRTNLQKHKIDLLAVCELLAGEGIETVMVEGGATIIGAFLDANLVDSFIVTLSSKLIGGGLRGLNHRLKAPLKPRDTAWARLDDDIVLWGRM